MAKKYSVKIENDEVVSVEVDGVQYDSPDQILDPDDRARVQELVAKASDEDLDKSFDEQIAKDVADLENQSARLPQIIAIVFLAVAVILLPIAIISGIGTSRAISKEVSARGRVIDFNVIQQSSDNSQVYTDFYYPVIEFNSADGTRQTVQLSEGSSPPAYKKGQTLKILYDPEQPTTARVDSVGSTILMWLVTGITGFLGVVFLSVAIVVLLSTRKAPKDGKGT